MIVAASGARIFTSLRGDSSSRHPGLRNAEVAVSVAGVIGRGLAAGAAGTVALTVAEKVEMKLTGRALSTISGQVGARLSGHDPHADVDFVRRLNAAVHWVHGVSMGVVRASLDAAGLSRRSASVAFFPLLWTSDAALSATLGIAPPPWRWSFRDLATDIYGIGVPAFATSGAYVAMSTRS